MERQKPGPLSLQEAKLRFRAAARTPDVVSYIRQRPIELMMGAFVLGMLLGGSPGARKNLLPLILRLGRL